MLSRVWKSKFDRELTNTVVSFFKLAKLLSPEKMKYVHVDQSTINDFVSAFSFLSAQTVNGLKAELSSYN